MRNTNIPIKDVGRLSPKLYLRKLMDMTDICKSIQVRD